MGCICSQDRIGILRFRLLLPSQILPQHTMPLGQARQRPAWLSSQLAQGTSCTYILPIFTIKTTHQFRERQNWSQPIDYQIRPTLN